MSLNVVNTMRGELNVMNITEKDADELCCQVQSTGKFSTTLMASSDDLMAVEYETQKIIANSSTAELIKDDNLIFRGQKGSLTFQRRQSG